MPEFTITNRKTGQRQTKKVEQDSIVIGRLGTNEIVLDSKTISRKHAEIVRIKNDYFLVDLESGNGTFLNNTKLKPHEKNILQPGDTIRVEEFEIIPDFEISQQPFPEGEDTDSGIIEIKMIKKVLSALDSEQIPSFEVMSEPAIGKKILFTDNIEELVIGRDPNCTFPIESPAISRRHAVIHKKWGGITVTDLKSKNGTLVNGEKIEERLLKDGDTITLGNINVLFSNPQEIDFNALSKEYETKLRQEEEARTLAQKPTIQEYVETPEKKAGVSEQAFLSVNPEEKKQEAPPSELDALLQDTEKEDAANHPPAAKKDKKPEVIPASKPSFSSIETILMGTGVLIFLSALIGLIYMLL